MEVVSPVKQELQKFWGVGGGCGAWGVQIHSRDWRSLRLGFLQSVQEMEFKVGLFWGRNFLKIMLMGSLERVHGKCILWGEKKAAP